MKFVHLPVGERFRYQGKVYSKTGPLAASDDQGHQRMIPRSAGIELLETAPGDAVDDKATVARTPQQALAEHHALGRELLTRAAHEGDAALAALLQRLDAAYGELLRTLG